MKKLLTIAIITAFIASASLALATPMYVDTYLHPNDIEAWQQDDDLIGPNPPYDLYGYDWSSGADYTQLTIYTGWNLGLSGQATASSMLGDVFFYDNDSSVLLGAVALRDHTSAIGEDDIIKAGWAFYPTELRYSDDYYGPGGSVATLDTSRYGDGEFVTAFGEQLGEVALGYAYDGGLDQYLITLLFPAMMQTDTVTAASVDSVDFYPGVRLAQTCGNDVLESVPEPMTIILLGFGLLGLAGFRRKE